MHPRTYPLLIRCTSGLMVLSLLFILIYGFSHIQILSLWLILAASVWSLLAVLFSVFAYRSHCVGFLLSTFAIIMVLRSLGVNGLYFLLIPALLAFLLMIVLFFHLGAEDLTATNPLMSKFEWQLTFIRMYLGFDLIAHCAEKLFAGPVPFHQDVMAFTDLGVPAPEFFVLFAGLCELGSAITLGLGFFTRIGALAATLYILVATVLGKHFLLGFIWANPGGGWEYPVLWSVLILSFAFFGAGHFSIDSRLKKHRSIPRWIQWLMG